MSWKYISVDIAGDKANKLSLAGPNKKEKKLNKT